MKTSLSILTAALVLFVFILKAPAQGTAFYYQGRLTSATGGAVTGSYDFTFALCNSSNGGNYIGPMLTNSAVGVSNGWFSALLNFGQVFDGNARWLQISVCTNGASNFDTLAPLQQLTPVPYAITASNALIATTISGSLPSASLAGNYARAVSFNNGSNAFSGAFIGNGAGLTNLVAQNIAGSLALAQMPSGVVTNLVFVTGNGLTNAVRANGSTVTVTLGATNSNGASASVGATNFAAIVVTNMVVVGGGSGVVPAQLSQRDLGGFPNFPVVDLRPALPGYPLSLDLMPNMAGTTVPPISSEGLITWFDVCDYDCSSNNTGPVGTARVGISSNYVVFGSTGYDGGVAKPLWFTVGAGSSPIMTLSNTYGAYFSSGTVGGVTLDGTLEPAYILRTNGNTVAFLGAATSGNQFFSGALPGDIALRANAGERIIMGIGPNTDVPSLIISTNGNVSIGTNAATATLNVGGNTVLGGNLQVASTAVFNGGISLGSGAQFAGNGGGLSNLPFAQTFASTNGYFSFTRNLNGSTNVTFVVTNVVGATGAGGTGNGQPASSNLTALASNNGIALTNLPFAQTFASTNGYFSFTQNPNGSTNVTFVVTNVVGATGAGGTGNGQPASSNLTALASNNGSALTNLPFAQTFASTNGYFSFTQNPNGSTNVTFVVTNVLGATGAGGTGNGQPASSNLTALASNNGSALTNLPFAKTFASPNGYFSFAQNPDGSTNVTFALTNLTGVTNISYLLTNVTPAAIGAQPASGNLTSLAGFNGAGLTNLPFAETFASTNGYFAFAQNPDGSTNVTFVVTNVLGATGAGGTGNGQPASSNLTALASNNGSALTNLPFAKTFASPNGYFSFAQNPDGSTNVTFALTNLTGVTNISYLLTNVTPAAIGAQPASGNLTSLAGFNGAGLTNLPFAETFASTNGYFAFAQNPDGSTNVTFVVTNVLGATGAGGTGNGQPASSNLTALASNNGSALTNLPFAKTFASPNGYFSFAQNPDGSTNVTFALTNLTGVTNISYLLTNVTPAAIGAQPASGNLTSLAGFNGAGLTNLPFAETFASTNGFFAFAQNPDGSTNVTFVVTNVVGATGAGGTGNGQPASSNLTALASNNGSALTNLPFAKTFASPNGYFSFAQNPDGSTNVTFALTNLTGVTNISYLLTNVTPASIGAQPASGNLTSLAGFNGAGLTNLPFAETFASTNGYFAFAQNPDGSTNVTFVVTNVLGATGAGGTGNGQPASSNLTALASNNGSALTNLPFAKTFTSTNGYYTYTQNADGSTNVAFVITNVSVNLAGAQVASSNLTVLAAGNGVGLTNLVAQNITGSLALTQMPSGVVTNLVVVTGNGLTNAVRVNGSTVTLTLGGTNSNGTNVSVNATNFAAIVVTNMVVVGGGSGVVPAQLSQRDLGGFPNFPVVDLRPALPGYPLSLDLMPNMAGTTVPPISSEGLITWLDVCDYDCSSNNTGPVGTARVGISSNYVVFGSTGYYGGVAKPLWFTVGAGSSPIMTLSNTYGAYFSSGTVGGVTLDGTLEPAYILRTNGNTVAYLGAATSGNQFFSGALPGDIALRANAGERIIMGIGPNTDVPSLIISTNGNVSIGTNAATATLNVGGNTVLGGNLQVASTAVFNGGISLGSGAQFAGNGGGLSNLPFAQTFASTNGYFTFTPNANGSTNVTFFVTNVVGAAGAGGTGNGQPASSNLTALASNNGIALTNLPFAQTFASTNGYFSFTQNPNGSTNVTFVVTNVLGATGAGGTGNGQPASSNLTALASNNGSALTNLPFAKTFVSPNGYFTFAQNPDGSTNVTFALTTLAGVTNISYLLTNVTPASIGAQPASSNLTALAGYNGSGMTNLPFAETFASTNGYFAFAQNPDGSTNVTFVVTNVLGATGAGGTGNGQPASSNLTALASNNGSALTNLPFAKTFASTNGFFSFTQNPDGSTNVTFVVTNVLGATGAGGTGNGQPASSNLTALASNNGGALTNLPFAKTFTSTNGYYTFTANADGSTNAAFVITNVSVSLAGAQVASSNLTVLAASNGGGLTNLPFAETFASTNGYFSFTQNPNGSTNVTFVVTNVAGATGAGGTGNGQPASSNLTALAGNNGGALTNLPFAKTFASPNGYFSFAQNPDGSTNVTFLFTNGTPGQVGAQPASSNLTTLASNNGIALTNLPFAETFASTNGYFSFTQNPNGSTNVTFVVTNVVGATGAGGTGNAQPASTNLTALAADNGAGLTNLPFAKTFTSTNGYYSYTQNADGSTNVAFVITNVSVSLAGAQVASSNLTVLAAGNGVGLTNLLAQNITGSLALTQMPSGVVTNLVFVTVNGLTNAVRANGSTVTVTLGATNSNGTNVTVGVTNFAAIVVTNMIVVGDGSGVVPAQLSQRDLGGFPEFPVVDLRPSLANYPLAFDLMPNMAGTTVPPVSSEGLITWFDVCDYDCSTNDTGPVGTARVGITDGYALFGSTGYGGGVAKPLWFAIGADASPVMTLSNIYGAYITSETVGGVTLDGTFAPAYVLKTNGIPVAYLGAATSANQWFAGSMPGDIALRANAGERILMGIQPNNAAPALIISANGNVSIGTNAAMATLNVGGNTAVGGTVQANNGFASSATSTATIGSTGWTNTFGINATVYVLGGTSATLADQNGNSLVNFSANPTNLTVQLHPLWRLAGTGLSGVAVSQ